MLQVVFSEYEGEKKIGSLPYTLPVKAAEPGARRETSLRMGIRVPVSTPNGGFNYMDVGTNIDCSAETLDGGRFMVNCGADRSSLYTSGPETKPENLTATNQPVVRRFTLNSSLPMRDGQTAQVGMATDPVNGHVLKMDITLRVVK